MVKRIPPSRLTIDQCARGCGGFKKPNPRPLHLDAGPTPSFSFLGFYFFRIFASLQVQTAELHRPRSAAATLTASSFKTGPWATTARQTEAWNRASTSGPAPIVPPGPLSPASCASSLGGPTPDSSRVPTLRASPSFNHLHSFDDFQKQAAEFAVAIPYIVQQNRIPLYPRTKNQTLPRASYFSLLSSGDHTRRTTPERSKMEV